MIVAAPVPCIASIPIGCSHTKSLFHILTLHKLEREQTLTILRSQNAYKNAYYASHSTRK